MNITTPIRFELIMIFIEVESWIEYRVIIIESCLWLILFDVILSK